MAKRKGGRPRVVIDSEQVEKLAALQCTQQEIAAFIGCDQKTISNRCQEELKRGAERGKMSLRRKQYECAMAGNMTMLIWLGKNYLDQSEKVDASLQQKILQVYGMKPIKKDADSKDTSE